MPKQPNILFILIDDMGWRDLSCQGSIYYETPQIDRLAAQGMRFTDAYASCPVCSPTRASLLTGKYPARLGMTTWIGDKSRGKLLDVPYVDHLALEEFSLAKSLKQGGYQTWHVGKWHLGGRDFYPEHHGFDMNIGGCAWGHPRKGYWSPYGIETLSDGPEGEYLTDRLTDEAINLIRNSGDQPFFLYMSHYAVHTPIQAKAEDVERFTQKAQAMGLDKLTAVVEGEFYPCEHKKNQRVARRIIQSNPVYAAMVWNLDWNIGRLLEALRANGKEQDTLVIFTSDNGGLSTAEATPTSNKPLNEGKGWMYEGGVREPLIIRWPGVVSENSITHEPVTTTDFYPTLLQAAGLPLRPEQHVDGESFLPLLQGEAWKHASSIFWHYPHYGNQGGTPGSAMRHGDWKLLEFFEDDRLELYNLRDDLEEKYDLAPSNRPLAERLREELHAWRNQVGGLIPQPNPEWN